MSFDPTFLEFKGNSPNRVQNYTIEVIAFDGYNKKVSDTFILSLVNKKPSI
jgi:hypothetical protein